MTDPARFHSSASPARWAEEAYRRGEESKRRRQERQRRERWGRLRGWAIAGGFVAAYALAGILTGGPH